MKNLVHELLMVFVIVQALCGTYTCSSFDRNRRLDIFKKTVALWELIHQFKKPKFTGKQHETPEVTLTEVNLLEEKAEFPEAIFGVPQSQEDSNAQLRQITKLLRSGADPNETESKKSKNGPSMLQVAILKGDLRLVEILLEHGANPYHRSMDGMHPLAMAINLKSENCLAIISALLKKGNLMNIDIPAGKNMMNIDIPETSLSPIQYAFLNGDLAVVEHLASRGAYVHLHDLLIWAFQKGHVGVIEILNDWIKKMPSEDQESNNYQNENRPSNKYRSSQEALFVAVSAGHLGAMRALLAFHDIDVNAQINRRNETVLYKAVKDNRVEFTKALLEDPRIDVNKIISGGKTIVGLLAGNCNDVNFSDHESFKLLCADPRAIIDSEDCVCTLAGPCCNSGMCDKHQFLKKARRRKQGGCCICS